ncbi:tetratricopeptide repeat protein [Mariniflexile ostreae]|uniref:Tetratricopeptide repeat protein n=1 Tax=Mariniflexile ostreae TaxID=1520892 RepID=A0ABV5FB46_9FLAO
MTNNAVQNAIESLVEKWQNAYTTPGTKMVCMTYTEQEESMMDAFLDYILALDNATENFVWIFESDFKDYDSFALDIAHEMQEVLQNWNTMSKPSQYDASEIHWFPKLEYGTSKNPMALLVNNLNHFAHTLFPEKEIKVCYVFKNFDISKKEAYKWAESSLELPFEDHVSWTVIQSKENMVYKKVVERFTHQVKEIKTNIDVNAVVEQLVAQADPTKPENAYRSALVKLMHAVEERNKDKVSLQAKKCLDIILEELKNDANWISQVVTVYVTLYNDQIGYKNYDDALYFATKAVEAAKTSQKTTDPSIGNRLAGQAYIGRGSVYGLKKNWENAHSDYKKARDAYKEGHDFLMQVEACRLCGWSGFKVDVEKNILPFYIEGFQLHTKLEPEILKNSTFPLILKDVVFNTNFEEEITKKELDKVLIPLFGEDYKFEIDRYGTGK